MRITLIVPAPFDTISGGYGYDRRIVAGLRASRHTIDVVELMGRFPLVDDRARAAALTAWDRLPPGTRPVIDGLALPAFQADAIAARDAVGLIHHPVSLETGLNAADQMVLAEIEHRLLPRMARLIVTSDTTAVTVATHFNIAPDRIHVVVPGTDEAPRCSPPDNGTCEILSVGTLIPRKGHDVLLRALAPLHGLDWHLTIVGSPDRDPAHARRLAALANELGVAHRVRFAGELVGDALDAMWRGADVFALATWYEGYGMVIAEALKRGLPVVVTDGGAAGALITPDAGRACSAGDSRGIGNSLRLLIVDRTARRAMAGRAWQIGQTLPSWETQSALFARSIDQDAAD